MLVIIACHRHRQCDQAGSLVHQAVVRERRFAGDSSQYRLQDLARVDLCRVFPVGIASGTLPAVAAPFLLPSTEVLCGSSAVELLKDLVQGVAPAGCRTIATRP